MLAVRATGSPLALAMPGPYSLLFRPGLPAPVLAEKQVTGHLEGRGECYSDQKCRIPDLWCQV